MAFTDEQLERLYGDLTSANFQQSTLPETPTEEITPQVPYKRLKQVANIFPKVFGSTAASINSILMPDSPDTAEDFAPEFETGKMESIADIALEKVVPGLAAWMVPYLGATKIAKLKGLYDAGRLIAGVSEGLSQAGATAFALAAPESESAVAENTELQGVLEKLAVLDTNKSSPLQSSILSGVSGFLQQTLPRAQRALPLAAVSAAHIATGGSQMEAALNFGGNMLPGAFKPLASSATTHLLSPSKFDNVLAEAAALSPQRFGSTMSPGEFSFIDQVQPRAVATPETTGNLFEWGENQTGLKLNRDASQMEFQMDEGFTSTGLQTRLNTPQETYGFDLTEPSVASSGLRLKGEPLQDGSLIQPELDPLLTLQTTNLPRGDRGYGEFSFMDDVPINRIDTTGDLFGQLPEFQLTREPFSLQNEFDLITQPPSGLKVDKLPRVIPEHVDLPVSRSGLSLEGAKPPTQAEFPLIELQGAGRDPSLPNFTMADNITIPKLEGPEGDLFGWRNAAVNRASEHPLLMPPSEPVVGVPPTETKVKTPTSIVTPKSKLKKVSLPETGKPFEFYSVKNTEKASNEGSRFGQDIEPHGSYMVESTEEAAKNLPSKFKQGKIKFENPLVIPFGEGYGKVTNWKNILSKQFGGKTGLDLTRAIKEAGYDGIITTEKAKGVNRPAHTSEIVDLRSIPTKTPKVEENQFNSPVHNKANEAVDDFVIDPESTRGKGVKLARKLHKDGLIGKDYLDEIERIGKDRDMGPEDIADEIKSGLAKNESAWRKTKSQTDLLPSKSLPSVEVPLPVVQTSTGNLAINPRMDGPHIISTVLDEGDGVYLAGNKWNSPHMEGDSIFTQNIEKASGGGKSAFLVRDADGAIRVVTDRIEAGKIADVSGQRPPGSPAKLHSQYLIEPPAKPKTVEQHTNKEKIVDAKELIAAKKLQSRIEQLTQDLKFAMDEGDDVTVRGITRTLEKLKAQSEAGFVINQTTAILTAGGVAGLVAYQQSKQDMGTTIAAGFIVAGLVTIGAKAFSNFKGTTGPAAKATTVKIPDATLSEKFTALAAATTKTPAGLAVGGRGGPWARTVSIVEDMFGLNRLDFYKDIKVKSGGFVDDILNQQAAALKAVGKVNPTDAMAEATGRFLRGQLNNPIEVQNLLSSGGIISDGFNSLDAATKLNYPEKWMQLLDQTSTNTKGEEVTIWHVTNSVKQQLVEGEKQALLRIATTPDDKKFAEYAFKTRTNFDTLQQTVFNATGPKEARKILGTMGQYMTRSHALIADPKWYPDEVVIQRAMDNLSHAKINDFLSSVEAGPVPIHYGTNTYHTTADKADIFNNLFTPESLRAVVTQQIREIKLLAAGRKEGSMFSEEAQLKGGLFTGRKELDAVRQALLGTHDKPLEMIRDTFNKLLPAAHSADMMLQLTKATEESGLAGRFASEVDFNKAISALRNSLSLAPDARAAAKVQNQLNELAAYIPIDKNSPAMGLFQGSYVSRHVHAQLEDMLNPFGVLDGVVGSGLRNFNTLFKETHLIWNPVVQARNAVQIPFLLVMGRAAHDVAALETAFKVVYRGDHINTEIGRWAVKNGGMTGNPVKGEMQFQLHELIDGTADNRIFEGFKKARQFFHLAYSKPDDFVRTATFIAAARREAIKLGVPLDKMHLDEAVTDAARQFMNRRAMDYANVPKWVKVGRQIPLVNPFLTYSHEIVRITKNMAVDAAKGDLVSGAGLAGLSTLPFLVQSQAESALPPGDRKAWLNGQAAAQDYSRPRFKIPTGRNPDGSFNYYDISPIMPFGDYLMMGRSLSQGDTGSALAINPIAGIEKSPLLNLAAAQITGKDIHTQREFRNNWDRALNIVQSITPPPTPGLGSDAKRDWPEWMGGKLGQTNEKTGRTYTIKGALIRNLFGVDESQVNPDIAIANMVKTAQHDIANERAYYRDAATSKGLSEEAKDRALQKYVNAVKYITDQLSDRINQK